MKVLKINENTIINLYDFQSIIAEGASVVVNFNHSTNRLVMNFESEEEAKAYLDEVYEDVFSIKRKEP